MDFDAGGGNTEPPGEQQPKGSAYWVVPTILGAAGLVGIAVGIGFAVESQSAKSDPKDIRRGSPGVCAQSTASACASYDSKRSDAESAATVSYVGYIAGGALLAGAAVTASCCGRARRNKREGGVSARHQRGRSESAHRRRHARRRTRSALLRRVNETMMMTASKTAFVSVALLCGLGVSVTACPASLDDRCADGACVSATSPVEGGVDTDGAVVPPGCKPEADPKDTPAS